MLKSLILILGLLGSLAFASLTFCSAACSSANASSLAFVTVVICESITASCEWT